MAVNFLSQLREPKKIMTKTIPPLLLVHFHSCTMAAILVFDEKPQNGYVYWNKLVGEFLYYIVTEEAYDYKQCFGL